MSHQKATPSNSPNVDVTLGRPDKRAHRTFPCPLCAAGLELRESRRQKPYCICNTCGVQLFFRGKKGIARLDDLAEREKAVMAAQISTSTALATFEMLERLRAQRKTLEDRRPLIFADKNLENAILAIDREIARVEIHLDALARGITDHSESQANSAPIK